MSNASAIASKRKHDGPVKRKRESDFAIATDSPLLGLSGRLLCALRTMVEVKSIIYQDEPALAQSWFNHLDPQ